MKILIIAAALGAMGAMAGCGPRGNEPNVELIQDMMQQPAIRAQYKDEFFKNGISSLVPPEKTQPVGYQVYRFGYDLATAEKENKNPFAGSTDKDVLLTGQKFFNTNCMVCHGQQGHGDGSVSKKFPIAIPALVSDKVRAYTDAHIFHIITMGQGVMGPYASHVPEQYRWQVVQYVRYLQSQDKK